MSKIALGVLIWFIAVTAAFFWWLPSEAEMKGCIVTKMYGVNLCPGSKDYVPLGQISPLLYKAIILTEDSTFYTHDGFDWSAIEKSAKDGISAGAFRKGGSTITQQLAKNMFLWKDRSFIRKGLEAILTYRLEKYLKKNQILERYLNVIEYGDKIYGIKKASRFYVNKFPAQLNAVESAFFAMLLPNPKKYSRSYFKKSLTPFAKKRVAHILLLMYKTHKIELTEYEVSLAKLDSFFSVLAVEAEIQQATKAEIKAADSTAPEAPPSGDTDDETDVRD